MAEAEAKTNKSEGKKRRAKRSRVAEEVVRMAKDGMCVALIAAEIAAKFHFKITPNAIRSILARQGVSLRILREEREARRWAPPDPEKESILPSPRDEELHRVSDNWALRHLRRAREEGKQLCGEVETALRAAGFRVPDTQHRRAAASVLSELRAQTASLQGHKTIDIPWLPEEERKGNWQPRHVIVSLTTPQERAVEEYLAACGLAEAGMEYWAARSISAERGRKKYLMPRSALEALRQAVASAGDEEVEEV